MNIDEIISHSLQKIPIFRDTHAIKGALSIIRLKSRYPNWSDDLLANILSLPQFLKGPEVSILFSEQVDHSDLSFRKDKTKFYIEAGLFPISYYAGIKWMEDEGFETMVNHYKKEAINTINDLGHGWTIWCSFYELIPFLKTPSQKKYACERFVEFVSQQFHKYGGNEPQPPTTYLSDSHFTPPSFNDTLQNCLEKPGFLGHNLLTLGYLIRHKNILSEKEYQAGIYQVNKMVNFQWNNATFEVEVDLNKASHFHFEKFTLEDIQRRILTSGLNDVHALTMADIVNDIWSCCDTNQKHILTFFLLNVFSRR